MLEVLKDKVVIAILVVSSILTFLLMIRAHDYEPNMEQHKLLDTCIEKVCVYKQDKTLECISLDHVYLTEIFHQKSIVNGAPRLIYIKLVKKCK